MFNVTIIKAKDMIKLIIILICIYFLSRLILKNIEIKNYLNQINILNTADFIKYSINTESTIIKNISNQKEDIQEENTKETLEIKSILEITSSIFKTEPLEENLGQDETNIQKENIDIANKEEESQMQETTTNVSTQVVTENPIAENYNREYNGVKIKNETSYELTDEILNTDDLSINKENIIIFHTHTCESYTQSQNYQYTASRKL